MTGKDALVSVVILSRNRKIDLINCITSLTASSYKNIEIIVIDNASNDVIDRSWFGKHLQIRVVRNEVNIGAAAGRNLGCRYAKGKYLLFMDDDAIADKNMISELISVLVSNKKIGIVQPKIYEIGNKKKLQGIGHDINLWTGRVIGIGIGELDHGQYDVVRQIPMAGCIWMIRKDTFVKNGQLDEIYFIPYEDSDFSYRLRKKGLNILFVPFAVAWHSAHKNNNIHPRIEWLGITSVERAYRISRNKIIFLKKNGSFIQFIFFIFILLPIYTILHSFIIISVGRFDILRQYIRGLITGLLFSIGIKKSLWI